MTRRTKIVCTLGPASSSPGRIRSLVQAGMDVARINFSHGTREENAATIGAIRAVADQAGRPISILGDLQGPKIRIGTLTGPRELRPGDRLVLAPEAEADDGELPTTYADLAADLAVGDVVLLADGMMELIVEELDVPRAAMRVIHGGTLSSGKGINLPGTRVSTPPLTDKDLLDLAFALDQEIDYIGLSFVREASDVRALRERIPADGPLVVVKIEKGLALDNLEDILEEAAAAMVARGDLGVELPFEEVPLAQKRMIHLANLSGRPVITATQMLESMIDNPRPTRAEASDVANAIIDGTDAIMLSAETAIGSYPVEAVKAMVRIAEEIERSEVISAGPQYSFHVERLADRFTPTERAIAAATVEAVRRIRVPLIVTFTRSGFSARVVSSFRPPVPILAVTDSERTYRQLALIWGVIPHLCPRDPTYDEMFEAARSAALAGRLASKGERIVLTAGLPMNVPGTTNLLRVETL